MIEGQVALTGSCTVSLATVPLVDGRWAYETQCLEHEEHITGGVKPSYTLVRATVGMWAVIASFAIVTSRRRKRKIVNQWADRSLPLAAVPDYQFRLPIAVRHPYVVATDASISADGQARWAAVTGAGWVRVGADAEGVALASPAQAELAAVIGALRMYPGETTVQVLCDNKGVVEVLRRFRDRRRAAHGKKLSDGVRKAVARRWRGTAERLLTPELAVLLGDVGAVDFWPVWVPRKSHRLHQVAHGFASTSNIANSSKITYSKTKLDE